MNGRRATLLCAAGLVAALALTALVYAPGLSGPMLFDDRPNILEPKRLRITTLDADSVVEAMHAIHDRTPRRGLAYLSFALNHYASGGKFVGLHLKITNLLIHLSAGLVLFWLSRRLARRAAPASPGPPGGVGGAPDGADLLALAVTAIWLLHPVQLTSVLYVVQRMTSLSALCVLAGVALYVAGRERLEHGRRGGPALMVAGIGGGIGLGVLMKENALLLPVFTALVEFVFFRREGLAPWARRGVLALHALCFGVPALAVLGVVLFRFDIVQGTFESRDFTPWERMLTQGRVMGEYVQMILLPRLSAFGLYHDDVVVSRGLLSPPSTALAALAWTGVAAATAWGLARRAGWAFGIAWFLGGHVMESSLVGLELMYEHRNYLPLAGLLLGVAISVRAALAGAGVRRRAVLAACVPVLALLAFLTSNRADIWSSTRSLMEFTTAVHPNSYRAQASLAVSKIIAGEPLESAYESWARAVELGTGDDHMALLELIKLVSFTRTTDVPEHGGECPPAGVVPQRLPESRECQQVLLDTLVAEMHRRAREEPVSVTTVVAFEHFGRCVVGGTGYCEVLAEDLEAWLRAVLEADRLRARMRPRMVLALARLRANAGDVDGGIALVEKAARESGYVPMFVDYLVSIYRSRGEPEKAREAVARLLEPEYWRPGNDAIARTLNGRIDETEVVDGAPPGTPP